MDINKAINEHFDRAFKNGDVKRKKTWVPTIAEPAEILRVPCSQCNALGTVWKSPCPMCSGAMYFEHRFPAAIVKLAKGLAHQDELSIARALTGLAMGMEINEP